MLSGSRHDLQLALRGLARRPGFSGSSIATLALGIGASTAIFSVAYGISFRPLPYAAPDRLIRIYEANPANGELEHDVAIGTFHAWRAGRPWYRYVQWSDELIARLAATPGIAGAAIT